ncbi:MAG: trypsin-like peptidase domain-containing protein [Alphaproteobacteria bacterium]|nr:trypsin-like peptidase domain-containing protein [Alphaproteobacteria bacterium]
MNFSRAFLLGLSAFVLSACVADQAVDLESRPIALDQNAEPAGAAGPQGAASVATLLPATGPTYVTLTVAETTAGASGNASQNTAMPITSGSGFVVSPDGYVVTAAHVAVAKGNEISARAANGRIYSGTVLALYPENDMALIKLRAFNGHSVMPAAPGCLAPGDLLYTLGKPHGGGDTARIGTLQTKHFGRPVAYGKFGYPDALVLHMGTQRGESGGPVFNNRGQLVGMVVSTLSDANGQSINMAHAIPANTIGKFFCSQGSCSPQWSALAALPVDNCG